MNLTTSLVLALISLFGALHYQDSNEWFGRGLNAFNRGNYAEAVESYSKALELDSTAATTWFNRAAAYMRLRQFANAHADLDRCLVIFPGAANMRMQRAIVRAEMGRFAEALDDVGSVIRTDSTFPKARLLRGRILLTRFNDTIGACSDLRAALAIGDSTALRYIRGACQ